MSERMGEDVARNAEARHDELMNERARLVLEGVDPTDLEMPLRPEPANATVLPEHLRRERDEARWWCSDCPTSHPTAEALSDHIYEQHPEVGEIAGLRAQLKFALHDAETCAHQRDQARAALAKAERALAASRADLTRVEAEADHQRAHKEAYLTQRNQAWQALDLARAELATARDELLRSRSWQVARNDAAGPCLHCGQPIVRGQAFEPVPTADGPHPSTKGRFRHCCCPNPEPTEQESTNA